MERDQRELKRTKRGEKRGRGAGDRATRSLSKKKKGEE